MSLMFSQVQFEISLITSWWSAPSLRYLILCCDDIFVFPTWALLVEKGKKKTLTLLYVCGAPLRMPRIMENGHQILATANLDYPFLFSVLNHYHYCFTNSNVDEDGRALALAFIHLSGSQRFSTMMCMTLGSAGTCRDMEEEIWGKQRRTDHLCILKSTELPKPTTAVSHWLPMSCGLHFIWSIIGGIGLKVWCCQHQMALVSTNFYFDCWASNKNHRRTAVEIIWCYRCPTACGSNWDSLTPGCPIATVCIKIIGLLFWVPFNVNYTQKISLSLMSEKQHP